MKGLVIMIASVQSLLAHPLNCITLQRYGTFRRSPVLLNGLTEATFAKLDKILLLRLAALFVFTLGAVPHLPLVNI